MLELEWDIVLAASAKPVANASETEVTASVRRS
jgi:hypothetical protein